jgi:Holliday junction resolvase RusA-like endonuclease
MTNREISMFLNMNPPTATYQEKEINWKTKSIYQNDRSADAKAKLRAHLVKHIPDQPLNGPLRMTIIWGFLANGEHRFNTWCTDKPDLDNAQKALQDIMTELGFWKDDCNIATLQTSKIWTWHPGIAITVEEMPEAIEDSYE